MTPDGHLRLPDGVLWPFCDSPVLFVRRCYAPLYEHVLRRLTSSSPAGLVTYLDRRIVMGQPGIGTSVVG